MKVYLLTIITTSVVVALAEMILPNGKLKLVVNTVFSITVLLSVVGVLKNINVEEYTYVFDEINDSPNYENLDYIYEHFDESVSNYYENLFISKLKDENLIAEKIKVEICNLQIIKVQVFLSNLVIPTENEHINNNVIRNYVSNVLQVDLEKVEVYV